MAERKDKEKTGKWSCCNGEARLSIEDSLSSGELTGPVESEESSLVNTQVSSTQLNLAQLGTTWQEKKEKNYLSIVKGQLKRQVMVTQVHDDLRATWTEKKRDLLQV